MRKNLLALLALAMSVTAVAQQISPAPGTKVDYLSQVSITFDDAASVVATNSAYYSPATSPAKVTFAGSEVASLVSFPSPVVSNTVAVMVSPDLATQSYITNNGIKGMTACQNGPHTFNIPAGAFTLYLPDGTSKPSDEIEFQIVMGAFTYSAATLNIDSPLGKVSKFSEATITFSPTPSTVEIADPSGFWLIDLEGLGYSVAEFEATVNDDNSVSLTLPSPYVMPGEFAVYVTEGALLIDGARNHATEGFPFQITGSGIVRQLTIMPEPDTDVEALYSIALIYEGYGSVSALRSTYKLVDADGGEYSFAVHNGAFEFPSLVFTPEGPDGETPGESVTKPGTYTLVVPIGSVMVDGVTNTTALRPTWTILGESGLCTPSAACEDSPDESWFDLNGRPIDGPGPGLSIRVTGGKAAKVATR